MLFAEEIWTSFLIAVSGSDFAVFIRQLRRLLENVQFLRREGGLSACSAHGKLDEKF